MDSNSKGIRMYEFNSLLRNRKEQMLNFPESSSEQMSHYIDIHLEDKSFDTVILHAGVNDLLNDNSQPNVDILISNIHKIMEKCKQVELRNIFVSGLAYTARVSLPIVERIHNVISNYCRENASFHNYNRNVRGFCLHKHGIHLLESRNKILANNFFVYLIKYCLETHTTIHQYLFERNHERLNHNKNPLIGYLTINSL